LTLDMFVQLLIVPTSYPRRYRIRPFHCKRIPFGACPRRLLTSAGKTGSSCQHLR
jgi:hypothetical protein